MAFTPQRLALAAAFVFLVFNIRPLLEDTSASCAKPILLEAAQRRTDLSGFPQEKIGPSFTVFKTRAGRDAASRNKCIDAARAKVGATTTRLAFVGVLGGGTALILGWRPRRGRSRNSEAIEAAKFSDDTPKATVEAAAVEDTNMHAAMLSGSSPVGRATLGLDSPDGDPPDAPRSDPRSDKAKPMWFGLFHRPLYRDWILWLAIVAVIAGVRGVVDFYYVGVPGTASTRFDISGRELAFAVDCLFSVSFQTALFGLLPAWVRRRVRRSKAPVAVAMPDPARTRP